MRPKTITITAAGASDSAWIPVDYLQAPFSLSVGCVISATATYSVKYTYDDIFTPGVTPTAFTLAGISAATTNKDSVISQPVKAVQLSVAANTGTVAMTLIQGLR